LQTRDGLTDDVAPHYAGHTLPADGLRPFPALRRAIAVLAGWLVPGAGHLTLGRYGRALLFFLVITGSFVLGLAIEGRLYWPTAPEEPSFLPFDLITVLWFFAQIGSGLCYIVSYLMGFGTTPEPWSPTFEYGNTFMFLAGLLNYLVLHDAYDIAAGRKR
jgi:hypothetical protein